VSFCADQSLFLIEISEVQPQQQKVEHNKEEILANKSFENVIKLKYIVMPLKRSKLNAGRNYEHIKSGE
jgi:hypothetical protein